MLDILNIEDLKVDVSLSQMDLVLLSMALENLPNDYEEMKKLFIETTKELDDNELLKEGFDEFSEAMTHSMLGQKLMLKGKIAQSVQNAMHHTMAKDLEKALGEILPHEVSAKAVHVPGNEEVQEAFDELLSNLGVNVGVLHKGDGDDYEEIEGGHEHP